MLLSRRGGAYWWPSWYPDCSYVLRGELKWIWITRTSCNSVRLRMVRCNKGDKSAFNSMYIFCQSNLGCYCSSLWFCLDGRNIRFTLENCLIPHFPFFFFFSQYFLISLTYIFFNLISKISVLSSLLKVILYSSSAGFHRQNRRECL